MAENSGISWTDDTFPLTYGCKKRSRGCELCWAIRQVPRLQHLPRYAGLVARGPDGQLDWTGVVREGWEQLELLGSPRRGRKIFVNPMADLFDAAVSRDFLVATWARMAFRDQHTYQILTKLSARLRAVLSAPSFRVDVARAFGRLHEDDPDGATDWLWYHPDAWPLPNVWVGVSVEDQAATRRLDDLADTPAAVKWVSAEPLVGPVNTTPYLTRTGPCSTCGGAGSLPVPGGGRQCPDCQYDHRLQQLDGIDWVVAGGESGPGAARMELQWARDLRDQCRDAGAAFWFKQLGAVQARERGCSDTHGAILSEIPDDLRIQEFPTAGRSVAA